MGTSFERVHSNMGTALFECHFQFFDEQAFAAYFGEQ